LKNIVETFPSCGLVFGLTNESFLTLFEKMFNQNEDHCSESELFGSLFEEPESYFKPKPKPHIEVFQRKNGGSQFFQFF
jgi:hypothetical protein